jgi:hypothetical protein
MDLAAQVHIFYFSCRSSNVLRLTDSFASLFATYILLLCVHYSLYEYRTCIAYSAVLSVCGQ